MIVMPAANGNTLLGYLAGRFPGRIGTMVSPATGWMKPHAFLPYALDNGEYADAIAGREWDDRVFLKMLDNVLESPFPPMFVVVPDVLYSRDKTLESFDRWAPKLEKYGVQLAMACQEDMQPSDVPRGVVAFIGCSEQARRDTYKFIDAGYQVHFGRVNSLSMLKSLHQLGVHSCDSSGWFRQGGDETAHNKPPEEWRIWPLLQYLEWATAPKYENMLFDLYEGAK